MKSLTGFLLGASLLILEADGFTTVSFVKVSDKIPVHVRDVRLNDKLVTPVDTTTMLAASSSQENGELRLSSRRQFGAWALGGLLMACASQAVVAPTAAAAAAPAVGVTIYKTGKAPIVPGQKPRDKGDTKGTRKDPAFLRSVSACKSQCEMGTGKDGYARPKEDCLAECQDICCTTYEQCTFAITPR